MLNIFSWYESNMQTKCDTMTCFEGLWEWEKIVGPISSAAIQTSKESYTLSCYLLYSV